MKQSLKVHLSLILLAVFCLLGCEQKAENPPPTPAKPDTNTPPAPAAVMSKAQAEKFQGRWLRPDGGYVLELAKVEESGKIEARYFNPQPIRVSMSEARLDGNTIKISVELRDTGYPGCIYTLAYDSKADQLFGTYFQAAMQQTFDVVFERMKPE